jgi:hypothetical protein
VVNHVVLVTNLSGFEDVFDGFWMGTEVGSMGSMERKGGKARKKRKARKDEKDKDIQARQSQKASTCTKATGI